MYVILCMCIVLQVSPVELHEPDKPDNSDKTIDKTTVKTTVVKPVEVVDKTPPETVQENEYASIDDVVYEDIKQQTKTGTVPPLTTLTVPQLRVLQVNYLFYFKWIQ